MSLLRLIDVHKSYEGVELLRGVSLSIDAGDRIGLVGRNASGKSTLMRLLAGAEAPDAGERVAKRGLRLGVLTQAPQLPPGETVRAVVRSGLAGREALLGELESVHAALAAADLAPARLDALLARQSELDARVEAGGGYDVEHRVEEVIERLGLAEPEALCGRLSGGERRRVDLARLLLDTPDLLLLDEPTNHLDALVIDWLEDALAASRVPFLLITHDRYFLDRAVTRILELDRGQLYPYEGGYADYLVARADRLAAEASAEAGRQSILRRESAWMLRGAPARTTKARARIHRYLDLVAAAPEAGVGSAEFELPAGPRLGTRVVHLEGVSKSFDGRPVLPPLDLELGPGERLGVIGPNGAGKSTLLQIITGRLAPDTGRVSVGETVRFANVEQRREDLDGSRTVVEEVAGASGHVAVDGRTLRVEGFLDRLLFPGARKHTTLDKLSGGEQNRVLLAKLLIQGGNVLLLDEPTNDLDLDTLRRLEEALLVFPGSAIVVSHDRYFLDRIATRTLLLDGRGGAHLHSGAASELLERLTVERRNAPTATRTAAPQPQPQGAPNPPPAPTSARPAPRPKRLAPWEQRELDTLPATLEAAEAELATLDARLADPSLYREPAATLAAVQAEHTRLSTHIATLYARWEALESRSG